jgi:hypothetical protein
VLEPSEYAALRASPAELKASPTIYVAFIGSLVMLIPVNAGREGVVPLSQAAQRSASAQTRKTRQALSLVRDRRGGRG